MSENCHNLTLCDEELVAKIKEGDFDSFGVLYSRYLPKMRTMAYSFQGMSYELEDLLQEAAIGFYTAINGYDGVSARFSTFCYTCIQRKLIGLIRKANRKKEIPHSEIVRLEDIAAVCENSPEHILIANEDFKALKSKVFDNLSDLERKVLSEYLAGNDYATIANNLGVTKKTVDNALCRVKKKLA